MILLAGRVVTEVPNRPYIFTAVPVPRAATRLPAVPHVRVGVPAAKHATIKLPAAPHYRTRRPRTKERLVAAGSFSVSTAGLVHARLGVEYAEQAIQLGQSGVVSVGTAGVSTASVSGTCVVRARYTVAANNTASVTESGSARARHTVDATQTITTNTTGTVATFYTLTATQHIETSNTTEARPLIDLEATQGITIVPAASTVPSVGSVNADASQTFTVDSVAEVRVRHLVEATQVVEVEESTQFGGIRIPLAASQNVSTSGQTTARGRYTHTATQTIGTASIGILATSLTASSTSAVTGSGTTRPRHNINASSETTAAGSATVTARTVPEEIMYTVTANNPATTTLTSVTNLLWLPSGPAATTVPLKAGNWVMFVWIAPSTQAGSVQFGVETSQGVTMRQMVNGDSTNGYTSGVKFTIPTDQSVTVKQKQVSTDAGLIGLKPGDVIAFAPIVTP